MRKSEDGPCVIGSGVAAESHEDLQTKVSDGFWRRLGGRFRFGLVVQEILDRLAGLGVVAYPYYIVVERIDATHDPADQDQEIDIRPLRTDEVHLIARLPERPRAEAKLRELMSKGTCLVARKDGQVLGYGWYGADRLLGIAGTASLCELPPGWAYLFDMYVRPAARGRKLAVQLRQRALQLLARQGTTNACSVSLAFNRSTRRFKAKLGAVETELRLLLRLKPLPGVDLRLWRKSTLLSTPWIRIVRRRRVGAR